MPIMHLKSIFLAMKLKRLNALTRSTIASKKSLINSPFILRICLWLTRRIAKCHSPNSGWFGAQVVILKKSESIWKPREIRGANQLWLGDDSGIGHCSGIENYSRYIDGRAPGTRPFCLLDYQMIIWWSLTKVMWPFRRCMPCMAVIEVEKKI